MTESSHYAEVANIYETAWCYKNGGEFQTWLAERIRAVLPPGCTTLADVGCGTGNFSAVLRDTAGIAVTGVEPSAEMAKKGLEHGMEITVADALDWAKDDGPAFGAILLKEVRHHFTDPATVYQGLTAKIQPAGRLISVTRPDDPIGYPFFEAAHVSWRKGTSIPLEKHVEALRASGLQVHVHEEKYPVSMPRAEWERLVRGRFWSHFAPFSDAEIDEGLKELKLPDVVEFNDCMTFTVAERPAE